MTTVFERLSTPRHHIVAERAAAKAARELAGCTFRPRVNKRPTAQASEPVFDRLIKSRHDIVAQRAALKMARELEGCTFRPKVNPSPPVKPPTLAAASKATTYPRPGWLARTVDRILLEARLKQHIE
ncbi:hypothetical protein SPRG_10219 [Saprolegnia parasitica CBS 223.65]|uniref:Uncharacterized protein n=1 Tax=Saprolegnia parasitica (strain CBS 223.65) TaxID=695850 RepID=A0A067C6E2_SAPPC|nr:hypothetical protein SPRG_10219 [Saprolegnia parasitica CBS 223.65]KDO24685.1 hypothetical protein SPRG_10219 [Saprolegnia parasitica CBS 223.65]|eukprot:XP_012204565.1 hypothetical protein SPRG_10219 [Saprolegnia parasitica CBS 223.65]